MGKYRVRLSGKGKRWKRGQSSCSNPDTTKYRDAARSGFFQVTTGESNLTTDALSKHDAVTGGITMDQDNPEEGSISSFGGKTFKTFDTFASDWTHCSNLSFNKLITNFKPDSAIQKELLAVLAAITEVIKERGGTESSTEYFAALMTALDSEGNDDSSVYAIITLLSMGIKSVPVNVLQLKFAQSTRTLMELLAKYAQSDNVAILRPIIGCLSVLLRSQEAPSWNDPYTVKVLDSLLAFITFSKPKIRKAAHHGIKVLALSSNITQTAVSHIGRYCVGLVENITNTSITSILHVLTLMKDIMHVFPKKEMKSGCEACLKVMTMQNVLVSSCCLQTLHGMLSGYPPAKTFPPDRNARLITALYDYQPPPADSQPTQAWVATMIQAHINLYRNDSVLCLNGANKLCTTLTQLYLCDKPEVMTSVTHSLTQLIQTIFSTVESLEKSINKTNTDDDKELDPPAVSVSHLSVAKSLAVHFKLLLSYQYHSAWTHIIHLIKTLFKSCRSMEYGDVLEPCLSSLGELRDSNQFCYNNEVESALGHAVKYIGPKFVLNSIPLKINKNDKSREFKRSWILPVLKTNIQGSDLKLFIDYFLPQAVLCRNESERLKSENDQIGSVSYDLLQSQIWSLLPSFATKPNDISASFPAIAKALGSVLQSKKDLRMSILACLRKLVNYSVESNNKNDLNTMSRYAKNYLPILFSIYSTGTSGTDEEATRLSTLETVKVYLKVADRELCRELFERGINKLKEEEKEEFVKTAVLDLIRTLIEYLTVEELSTIYGIIRENLENQQCNHRQQKKYFRLIEEICSSESDNCNKFVNQNLDTIKNIVINSLSNSAASSKGARLRCLIHLFERDSNPIELISLLLPETVLCVKDINSNTRDTAYNLLLLMADVCEPELFVTNIMAGLAGSTSTIACSLLALAAVVYHYKDKISKTLEDQILHNVSLLSICATREIVTAALSFIKVYIVTFPRDKIASFIPSLMNVFSKMNEDVKRGCRTKVRDLLARLVRWYGGDLIMTAVPPHDLILKARVRNLAKIHSRRKRDKESAKESSKDMETDEFTIQSKPKSIEEILAESESDMDLEDNNNDHIKKNTKKGKAWITETPEDIIDFTDHSTSKKISASKPTSKEDTQGLDKKKHKKKVDEFKRAPDGRLIISDLNDSDDESGAKTKKFVIPGLEDSEDDYVASEGEDKSEDGDTKPVTGRKRTLSTSTAGTSAPPNKYKAGVLGIHRPIKTLLSKNKPVFKKTPRGSNKGPTGSTGKEYRTKKAGGDMKKKGLPDPYAYVPLRRDTLNRRKKMKAAGQFKHFVKGTKKVAKIGLKQKTRR